MLFCWIAFDSKYGWYPPYTWYGGTPNNPYVVISWNEFILLDAKMHQVVHSSNANVSSTVREYVNVSNNIVFRIEVTKRHSGKDFIFFGWFDRKYSIDLDIISIHADRRNWIAVVAANSRCTFQAVSTNSCKVVLTTTVVAGPSPSSTLCTTVV